jgi:23S rRNA (guanosine2251-2'-O)-methyltransferase
LVTQVNLAQGIKTMKDQDIWVIGLDSGPHAQPLDKKALRGSLALVIGAEGQGLRPLIRKSCDHLLQLPMRGNIESLNAAVAGSIALYLAWEMRAFNQ